MSANDLRQVLPINVRHESIFVVHAEDHFFNLFPLLMRLIIVRLRLEASNHAFQFPSTRFTNTLHEFFP